MKRFILLFMTGMFAGAPAFAAEDTVARAMKLYEKRHYNEAAAVLRADLASIEQSRQGAAKLTLGMAYLRNALLHRELAQAAATTAQEYLKKLTAAQGPARSRFVDFYYGDALLEAGKPGVAAIYLEKFAGSEGVDPQYRSLAKVCLGLCYYRNNEAPRADPLWAGVDASDPEVKAELAAAYDKAGLADKNPQALIDESIAEMKRLGRPFSMRMVKNIVAVYARAGLTEKGLDLIKHTDLKACSYRETLGKSKVITFYDLSLFNDMALLYGQASIAFLEKAASDPKTRDVADFSLAQAYALFGSIEQSSKVASAFVSSSQMPAQYKDRIRVWQGANLYQKNRATDAVGVWDELARKQPEDADVLAELLFTCSRLRIECTKIVQQSAAAIEAGEGKKYANLNNAVGKYHLGKLDPAKALMYLEAGRDKSNKNKIESNEPVILVSLADAYFRTKKYSEALEIYFEMSKQFPEVRQIQDSMQGVYAMEHKSAGDVKIN